MSEQRTLPLAEAKARPQATSNFEKKTASCYSCSAKHAGTPSEAASARRSRQKASRQKIWRNSVRKKAMARHDGHAPERIVSGAPLDDDARL